MTPPPYLVVTPAHNEAAHIPGLVRSILAQDVGPAVWVIADDGSTDGTGDVARTAADEHPFIVVLDLARPAGRRLSSKADAVAAAYAAALERCPDASFVVSIDADVEVPPNAFSLLLDRFADDPGLGVAGGVYLHPVNGTLRKGRASAGHVPGPLQMFRREVFDAIGGYRSLPDGGLDTVATAHARMLGWRTKAFDELTFGHNRRMGTGGDRHPLVAEFHGGRRDRSMGTAWPFQLAKCVRRLSDRPIGLAAAARLVGYTEAALRRRPSHVPAEVASFIRAEQRDRLDPRRLLGRARPQPVPVGSGPVPSGHRAPSPPLRVLAWPAESPNPYVVELYREIATFDPTVEVENFRVTGSWRSSADVIHVHWPEAAVESESTLRATAKTATVLATLALHKLRGAELVWTCHNLRSHDRRHPRLESALRRLFEPMVDGVIHLSEDSRTSLAETGRLVDVPSTVVAHGHFAASTGDLVDRREARLELGLDPDTPVLAFVGMIRPYKNVPTLIEAFAAMSTPAQLIVAGNPADEATRSAVLAAAEGTARLRLDDRWLTEDEVSIRVRAADVVVLAYRDVLNSGVAILAAGLGRPVVINPVGSLRGFADVVGRDWVFPLTEPLSGPTMDRIVDWAGRDRPEPPSMEAFDPGVVAARTVAFYRQLAQR